MAFELPKLPYAMDALAPNISAETLEFHHGKHHATYVTNLNNLIKGGKFENAPLEQIIKEAGPGGLFNNAAQHFNHSFYWTSMKPKGGGEPAGKVADGIKKAFGDFAAFKKKFSDAATTHFGSGWAWLVQKSDGSARRHRDPRRRFSRRPQYQADPDLRRLGARVLYRLSQCACEVCRGVVEPGQLGFRQLEFEVDVVRARGASRRGRARARNPALK